MRIIVAVVAVLLTACSLSPKEAAFRQVNSMGCSFGNGDAYRDLSKKSVDLDYFPKEELKMFIFGEYAVTNEDEKSALKQLFKLSARGCYLEAIKKQQPDSFK